MPKYLKMVFILLLISDLTFSFYQHLHMPLDGDMAEIILPTPDKGYYDVLHSPFGIDALAKDKLYANPNRFFAHWTTSYYFLHTPLFLQKFVKPIESVYLASAISKTIIQILILYLFALYISNTTKIYSIDFLVAAILITPLFQTSGYSRFLGIIDQSVIYTFFYALPLGLILIFFFPFFKAAYHKTKLKMSGLKKIIWGVFMLVLSLNGPLLTGIALITSLLFLSSLWYKNYKTNTQNSFSNKVIHSIKKIDNLYLFYFIGFSIFSLYSLFIGQLNSLNFGDNITIWERYARLPIGLFNLVSQKLAYPLLFLLIAINLVIIYKYHSSIEGKRILHLSFWIGVFALLYILLLPLGGFRIYRPNIIRYDTVMPITFGIIFIYGFSTFFLVKQISKKNKIYYLIGIALFLLVFTNADKLKTEDYNRERAALETIAISKENPVILTCDCPVMDWSKYKKASESDLNASLFLYWNITKTKKLYYHRKEETK